MTVIYYPFTGEPKTGGDYVNLDHLKTLSAWGIDARIAFFGGKDDLPNKAVFGDIPITYQSDEALVLNPDDIFVIPEGYPGVIEQFSNAETNSCRVIMHNQNPFLTHTGTSSAKNINTHATELILVPSAYTARRLREMGITKPTRVIHPYIPDYFAPKAKSTDPIIITYSSRKRSDEVDILKFYFSSLYHHNSNIQFVNILGSTRQEVAEFMAKSAIFLSFAEREAMGLMALEAMASGCHVIGFSGYSGGHNEFMNETNGDWVAEGDYLGFVHHIFHEIERIEREPNILSAKAQAGLQTVAQRFRRAHFEADLKAAYEQIFGYQIGN